MQQSNIAVPIAIVAAGILVAGAIVFTNKSAAPAPSGVAVQGTGQGQVQPQAQPDVPKETYNILADDHILGNPTAPIRIIEYSDFQCPFCKRFHPTMTQIMDEYGKNGEVAWIYRHFPLDTIHPQARPLAYASECAKELGGETAFWKFNEKVMGQQVDFNMKDLSDLAKAAGVDAVKLQSCTDSEKYKDRVDRDFTSGVNAGVAGTPFSFVVGKDGRVDKVNGAFPYANVKSILDSMLAAKPGSN